METVQRTEAQRRLEREAVLWRRAHAILVPLWFYKTVWNDPPLPPAAYYLCLTLIGFALFRLSRIAPKARWSRYAPFLSPEGRATIQQLREHWPLPMAGMVSAVIGLFAFGNLRQVIAQNEHKHLFLEFLTAHYPMLMWSLLALFAVSAIAGYRLSRAELNIYRSVVPDLGR